jgi:hypothetical protein
MLSRTHRLHGRISSQPAAPTNAAARPHVTTTRRAAATHRAGCAVAPLARPRPVGSWSVPACPGAARRTPRCVALRVAAARCNAQMLHSGLLRCGRTPSIMRIFERILRSYHQSQLYILDSEGFRTGLGAPARRARARAAVGQHVVHHLRRALAPAAVRASSRCVRTCTRALVRMQTCSAVPAAMSSSTSSLSSACVYLC